MKKRTPILMITVLAFTLILLSAGCSTKESPLTSTSPSPSVALPSATPAVSQSAEPSPTPSLIIDPPPLPSDTSAVPQNNGESDFSSPGYALMENDGLGEIYYRMSESELIQLLGEPESKSETVNWGADGLDHTDWNYPLKGLVLNMIKLPDDVEASVFSITASTPCNLATHRGIKLGDTYDTVLKAYAKEFNDLESGKNGIVLGTVYGGIIMNFENGVVTSIFIGAAAE